MRPSVERHLNILEFTLASLLRRKGKNTALFGVYLLVVFLLASLLFFVSALKREASAILADAPDMVVQRLMAGRQDLVPSGYAEEIVRIRGVSAVRSRLWGYYYDASSGSNFTVIARDENDPAGERVTVGSGVARARKLSKGDLLPLLGYDRIPVMMEIGSIVTSESDLAAADLIIVSPRQFRTLFKFPEGQATDLAVTVRNQKELPTVAAKIAALLPDSRPILKSEILRTYRTIFDWRGGLTLMILTSAFLSFVIFAWDRATGLSAEERREIGILKSIGWETSDVLLHKMWEGGVVSLTAFLVGTVLAYGHVFLLSAPLFSGMLKGWSVLYPRFQLAPVVDMYQLSILFFLTVAPYTIVTVIPCWRAATTDPDAAMRY